MLAAVNRSLASLSAASTCRLVVFRWFAPSYRTSGKRDSLPVISHKQAETPHGRRHRAKRVPVSSTFLHTKYRVLRGILIRPNQMYSGTGLLPYRQSYARFYAGWESMLSKRTALFCFLALCPTQGPRAEPL